jgi:hypothetical protein
VSQTQGYNNNTEGQTLVFSGSHLGVWWDEAYYSGEQNAFNMVSIFAALRHDSALENVVDGYAPTVSVGPPPNVLPPPTWHLPVYTVTHIYGNGPMCGPWMQGCRPAWDGPQPDNPAPPDYYGGTATPEPGTAGLLVLSLVLALALKLAQRARDAVRR